MTAKTTRLMKHTEGEMTQWKRGGNGVGSNQSTGGRLATEGPNPPQGASSGDTQLKKP
jgi:hypothetical protein